jgi:hypothetical protein
MERRPRDQVRHWPQGLRDLLVNLPDGHWFYEGFERLNRTPQPEEILAAMPAPGLLRDVEDMTDDEDEEANGEGEEEVEEAMEGGLSDDGDNREHRRISSHSVQSTDTVYPLTVNEVVVPNANALSVNTRHVNHVVVEEPVVPLHDFNYDRMHVPLHQAMPSAHRASADPDADIVTPLTFYDRMILIDNFRNEILRDWVNDMLASDGLGQFRLAEGRLEYNAIDGIIRAHAARYNLPYVGHDAEIHHHWRRGTYEAEYTIVVDNEVFSGTAAELEPMLCGLRYALWVYWAVRPRMRSDTVLRWFANNGYTGFYCEIAWHLLPLDLWLDLWRERRASRRG